MLISGLIVGKHITIGNVYAPNVDCPNFMSHVILKFNQLCKNMGFLGGDFNCILDGNLDKSSPQISMGCKSSHILRNTCKDLGLVDIWRELILFILTPINLIQG